MSSLENAELAFPIQSWLSKFVKVYGGGRTIYADCPFCGKHKRLGIPLRSKTNGRPMFVCGRCKDGGHGGGVWNGATTLTKFVSLLEGIDYGQACKLVHSLAGVEEVRVYREKDVELLKVPESAIPLTRLPSSNAANEMLRRRHVGHLVNHASYGVEQPYIDRVLIPCYYQQEYLGYEAKTIHKHVEPKSLFPPEMPTDVKVYTAVGNTGNGDLAITESVLDAETFHLLPLDAVGCFGNFKQDQATAILDLKPKRIFWFLDGDTWSKIWNSIKILLPFADHYLPPMQEKDDPNALGPLELQRRVLDAVKVTSALDVVRFEKEVRNER